MENVTLGLPGRHNIENSLAAVAIAQSVGIDNEKIKNIQHMTNLKILDCCGRCGISDENIKSLNLIKLKANYNEKIKNILVGNSLNLQVLQESDPLSHP